MGYLLESLGTALGMIIHLNGEVLGAVGVSLATSLTATVFSTVWGVPLGAAVGVGTFPGRRIILTLLNTLMALPTVVVGLLLFGLFSRQGPLGGLGLLFTPWAMIAGQTVLATPIIANYTLSAVTGADPRILPTALTLGAGRLRGTWQLLLEVRFGVMAAIVAGFGRVIAEVGVAMMLGGNIRGYTRTMTTAIALETSKGEFAFGLALGMVLLSVALMINLFLNLMQQR
ncbi:ABC transporter permease [Geothermobacter hydrogeniphilus]|uniref:ABC transporter permease n=1 Tax=Geothermobacter hydrogeniphilus TaxID=1969733 RepID=A0A1X0Y5G9_9BACT|nr:ABC transporter permease [Geothermobacter hydrogeniphilus]ORJ60450.1 ABC transporter permease [Geothermobacter hydrogeniphilus]